MAPNRKDNEPRSNDSITADPVRVVDADGEMVGVISLKDALDLANEAGLDLVEVSPAADPPVCKILDFGKYKYEAQKKANEARKKQKIVHIKEIKIRPNIEQHDYDVKMRKIRQFLADEDKVKVTLRFRGREMSHMELGTAVLQRIRSDIGEDAKIEVEPKLEGRQMVMVLGPK